MTFNSAQEAIDDLKLKQGHKLSVDPLYSASVIQAVYDELNEPPSLSAIAIDRDLPELDRTLSLPATTDPLVSVSPVFVDLPELANDLSGSLLTANADGTISVNQDIKAFRVSCACVCRYAANANVSIGIGIGDPSVLPSFPGESTDVLPGGTYISRFVDNQRGENNERHITLQAPYFPVGKTNALGAKAGDKIFIALWTEKASTVSVIVDDLIFAVEAMPL